MQRVAKLRDWDFGYDVDEASAESAFSSNQPSLTVQSQKEDADINVIVKRFGVTGQLPATRLPPQYGDFTGVADYRQALDIITAAGDSFMSLPAAVRATFDNDPAKFVDFAVDPKNIDKMVEWGLADKPKPVNIPAVQIVGADGKPVPAAAAPAA